MDGKQWEALLLLPRIRGSYHQPATRTHSAHLKTAQQKYPDHMSEEKKSPAPKDLDHQSSQLQDLSKQLTAALKPAAQSEPDFCKTLESVLKIAELVDWPSFLASLRAVAESARAKQQADLHSRRQSLHHAARAAGIAVEGGGNSDRIDIFQVDYDGATAVVKLSDIAIERFKLSDGTALFIAVRKLRSQLEDVGFDRESFFNDLKAAYAICRRDGEPSEEFVLIVNVHRELLLERARKSGAFRRNPDPKYIPAYPLFQFVFDLARFIRGGVSFGGMRLKTTTPSLREANLTVHIPNLDHPTSPTTAAARLAISAV